MVLVIHFNLKKRKSFSVLNLGLIKNVTRESFKSFLNFTKINIKLRFDGKTVSASKSTVFDHNGNYHLASYLGQPLTVGSWRHPVSEIMNVETGQWKLAEDYPFHSS